MAYSQVIRYGNGVTRVFAVNFEAGWLNKADVTARVGTESDGGGNPVYRNITFLTDTTLQIDGAVPANGQIVTFTRTVGKGGSGVVFGNGDVLEERNLDVSFRYLLHLVHEILDGRITQFNSDLDLGGFKIRNSYDFGAPGNEAPHNLDLVNAAWVYRHTYEMNQQINSAIATAGQAVTTANSSVATANAATAAAQAANQAAGQASTQAQQAQTVAGQAVSTAQAANTAAGNAVQTANQASTAAQTANQTANAAVTTANGAASTASNAASVAGTASTKADSAIAQAGSATTTANQAVGTANNAVAIATGIAGTAQHAVDVAGAAVQVAQSAETTANTALNVAGNANTVAGQANTTANAASTKVDVLEQLINELSPGGDLSSNGILNASTVTGANVSEALDWLKNNAGLTTQQVEIIVQDEINSYDTAVALPTRAAVSSLQTTVAGKLDKPATGSPVVVVQSATGEVGGVAYGDAATPSAIAQRNANGHITGASGNPASTQLIRRDWAEAAFPSLALHQSLEAVVAGKVTQPANPSTDSVLTNTTAGIVGNTPLSQLATASAVVQRNAASQIALPSALATGNFALSVANADARFASLTNFNALTTTVNGKLNTPSDLTASMRVVIASTSGTASISGSSTEAAALSIVQRTVNGRVVMNSPNFGNLFGGSAPTGEEALHGVNHEYMWFAMNSPQGVRQWIDKRQQRVIINTTTWQRGKIGHVGGYVVFSGDGNRGWVLPNRSGNSDISERFVVGDTLMFVNMCWGGTQRIAQEGDARLYKARGDGEGDYNGDLWLKRGGTGFIMKVEEPNRWHAWGDWRITEGY